MPEDSEINNHKRNDHNFTHTTEFLRVWFWTTTATDFTRTTPPPHALRAILPSASFAPFRRWINGGKITSSANRHVSARFPARPNEACSPRCRDGERCSPAAALHPLGTLPYMLILTPACTHWRCAKPGLCLTLLVLHLGALPRVTVWIFAPAAYNWAS